eukprot:m.372977 g.372977  ORF g.372977 m.372977 type:complete len:51 (-) comp65278_c0_seq1:22-174(-)
MQGAAVEYLSFTFHTLTMHALLSLVPNPQYNMRSHSQYTGRVHKLTMIVV